MILKLQITLIALVATAAIAELILASTLSLRIAAVVQLVAATMIALKLLAAKR